MNPNPIDEEKRRKGRPDLIPSGVLLSLGSHLLESLTRYRLSPGDAELRQFFHSVGICMKHNVYFIMTRVGDVLGYGWHKHGECTWRIAGTDQAHPQTHFASASRHVLEYLADPLAQEEGSNIPVLYHATAQLCIVHDLIHNPPTIVGQNDGQWSINVRE